MHHVSLNPPPFIPVILTAVVGSDNGPIPNAFTAKVLLIVFICLGEIFFSGTKDLALFAKSLVHFKFLRNGDPNAKILFVADDELEITVRRREEQ